MKVARSMTGFRKMLADRQEKVKSLVCVGLDPLAENFPNCLKSLVPAAAVEIQMVEIVNATAKYASMFKPQIAHWEAIPDGIRALKRVIREIHVKFPDIPVFLDCKRGDIARTQKQYKVACLDILGADGMNFSPGMGEDCMSALVDQKNIGRALVGLCYTSNSSAREMQDGVYIDVNGVRWEHYWEFIAERTLKWATDLGIVENAGLIMAAAYEIQKELVRSIYSKHLTKCREIVGDKLWFLIPGIGAQGGFIEETVRAAYAGPGSIAINSSSEICFASSDSNYAEAAGKKACELRDKINASL